MTDLSPEARRILGLARRGDDPLERDRTRNSHRLAQRLAVAASATGAVLGTANAAAGTASVAALGAAKVATGAAATAALLGKGIVVGALFTAATLGTWHATNHFVRSGRASSATHAAPTKPTPATSVSRLPAEVPNVSPPVASSKSNDDLRALDADPEVAVGSAPGPSGSRVRAIRPPIGRHETPSVETATAVEPTTDPLFAEAAGLRDVQKTMSHGQVEHALTLVAEQDARYPNGALVQERAAARIFALCGLGRGVEARQQAQSFEQRFPRSPLITRVRHACGSDAQPPEK